MKTYTEEELNEIVSKHNKWLNNQDGGERANLQSADLRSADLQYANLRSANLQSANLQSADLRSADLDFSCLPLWCGGQFKADKKICQQLLAHSLRICELSNCGSKKMKKEIADYIKGWHRENEF